MQQKGGCRMRPSKGKISAVFVSIYVALFGLALFFPCQALADEDGRIKLTDSLALQIAQEFADSMTDDSAIESVNPVKFYDESGRAIGYIVAYRDSNGDPNGYVVLDSSDSSLFAEWSFEEGASTPISRLEQNVAQCYDLGNSQDARVFKSAPFTYAIALTQNDSIIDMYGKDISSSVCFDSIEASPGDSSWDDIFIDGYSPSYTMTVFEHVSGEFTCFPEYQIEEATGKYACAVTAMLNCLPFYYSGFNWGDWSSDYNALWSLSDTTVDYVSNGIQYGWTANGKIGPGFSSYLRQKGVTVSYVCLDEPSWSFFKNTIDRDDMAIFCAGIMSNGSRSGHAMAVAGYSILRLSSGISEDIYTLMVADGWNQARFVNIYFTRYTDTYGISFS